MPICSGSLKLKSTFFVWRVFFLWPIATIITPGAVRKLVGVPLYETTYGTQSITAKSVKDWNTMQNQVVFEFNENQIITPKLISALKNHFFESYIASRLNNLPDKYLLELVCLMLVLFVLFLFFWVFFPLLLLCSVFNQFSVATCCFKFGRSCS